MKKIYQKIWNDAKPYYQQGRPMDIDHIEWMMKDAIKVCKEEEIDDKVLIPLVILHDVGYAEVPKDNPYKLNLRKMHMAAGEKIARRILEQLKYPQDITEKIAYDISVHDNWALEDYGIYKQDLILATFQDLDFIWMATPKGFPAMMDVLKKTRTELIRYIENDNKLIKLPFATKTTKKLYEQYIEDRKNEKDHDL